ncbi:MAG TPA: response regulator [Candidatus Binataceae bacterium]|nr:response regulator [Candidatus Binataceae bacterium]
MILLGNYRLKNKRDRRDSDRLESIANGKAIGTNRDYFRSATAILSLSIGVIVSDKILIVDDEVEVADSCARVLKRAGFNCILAHNGPAGIAAFDSARPALVLSDINLGVGDGFEIARHVRDTSPATPVILMTTHHSEAVSQQANRDGASRYLRKPFSNFDLVSMIKSLLSPVR